MCIHLQRNESRGKKKPCRNDVVGKLHFWDEVEPSPLPLYKRILGGVKERCKYCGATRDNYDHSSGL